MKQTTVFSCLTCLTRKRKRKMVSGSKAPLSKYSSHLSRHQNRSARRSGHNQQTTRQKMRRYNRTTGKTQRQPVCKKTGSETGFAAGI